MGDLKQRAYKGVRQSRVDPDIDRSTARFQASGSCPFEERLQWSRCTFPAASFVCGWSRLDMARVGGKFPRKESACSTPSPSSQDAVAGCLRSASPSRQAPFSSPTSRESDLANPRVDQIGSFRVVDLATDRRHRVTRRVVTE